MHCYFTMKCLKILVEQTNHMINKEEHHTEKLFSYGTLQYEHVQLATFGRKLHGHRDLLLGYKLSRLQITNPEVISTSGEAIHPVLIHTGNQIDQVEGMVFDISADELQRADTYEVANYKRVQAQLLSGISAWVYIGK